MRGARLLLALMTALAVSACARQQQTYYVIDPNTGQPVPVINQQAYSVPSMPPNSGFMSAQASANTPKSDSRGLFSSSPAYAQQTYADQAYAQAAPQTYAQPQTEPSGRGLFGSRGATYAQQPTYAQPQPRQPYVAQYNPPPQQYAPQPQYAPQYQQQGGPYAQAPQAYVQAPQAYASAPSGGQQSYTLDSGDKLRVVVFGQDGITNSYTVDAGGNISLPLVGSVPARGYGTQQLSQMIAERLKQGYVREPHVSVEVEGYRPFFILGEVRQPGQFPYVTGMTVEMAVAIAGGYGDRANERKARLSRRVGGITEVIDVPRDVELEPGDTIYVYERFF